MGTSPHDTWSAGDRYEPYIGRWSRRVAVQLVDWLGVPPGGSWLDVGCGTGALTTVILERAQPREVVGIDPSIYFVSYAQQLMLEPRASFQVGDAQALPVDDARFDVAAAALVLNFVPKPALAVAEMARSVKQGGTVAAYVWDYAGRMDLMRRFWAAAADTDPAAAALDEAGRFPMCRPEALTELFAGAGLQDVQTLALDIETPFRDFDDYWLPFLGGQGPAPSYAMSLSEAERDRLRERLSATVPRNADGSISMAARAWGVRGVARRPPAAGSTQ
jgi:SAM-dependent methyltransferase